MHKIVSVLKCGGEYKLEHVVKLQQMLYMAMTEDFEHYCISDDTSGSMEFYGIHHIPIKNEDWPKWWPKIEMFRYHEDLQGGDDYEPILYIDLDTVITGDLSEFFYKEFNGIAVLKDQLHYKKRPKAYGSGIILFHPNKMKYVYDKFIEKPKHYMEKHKTGGDQHFLEEVLNSEDVSYLQDLFPNQLYSYKINLCKDRKGNGFKGVPDSAKIVYFHGKPRPQEINYLGY